MKEGLSAFLPLSSATLHILLSLAGNDLHGYAIMQEVLRQSEGQYKLGPGTLYDNLQRLIDQRFIQELGHRDGDDDPRRRYYRLTSRGRGVLAAEVSRLEGVVREGKLRLLHVSANASGRRCCPFSIISKQGLLPPSWWRRLSSRWYGNGRCGRNIGKKKQP
jgi:DNA-binding PadR family transcriptional regulator